MSSALSVSSSSSWIKTAARIGLSAKGVVYCVSGLLATMACLHLGNNSAKNAGTKGVFSFIEDQPLGKWLLLAVALGLACYVFWRLLQSFKDTENKGTDKKGLAKRFAYFFSALAYAGLAVYAFKAFLGAGDSGKDNRQSFTSELLQQPFGQWLVGIVAAIMIGTGLYQLYRGISGKYKKYVRDALHKDAAKWITTAGTIGYSARGIVWLIIGWLFIKAALHSNANEVGGSDKAFSWLQDSYGTLLLGAVAIGLICYGVFTFLRAKYQDIHTN